MSTNFFSQAEIPFSPVIHYASALYKDCTCISKTYAEPTYYITWEDIIVIHDIWSCALTCPYYGIIFPDQALYL